MDEFLGLAPLLTPLWCFPTLKQVDQEECRPSVSKRYVYENILFSQENVNQGKWWTRITHAFVHHDLAHLFSNLKMLIPSAISVQQTFGKLIV